MAVLSDAEIRDRIFNPQNGYKPLIEVPDDYVGNLNEQIGANGIDLRLNNIIEYETDDRRPIKLADIEDDTAETEYTKFDLQKKDFYLPCGEIVLGYTMEKINMHPDLCGRFIGRSKFARKAGLDVELSAPTVGAGFEGQITAEMTSHRSGGAVLTSGVPVFQMLFETMNKVPERLYDGEFKGQEAGHFSN